MSANARQVGGKHYAATYQHWDWVTDLNMPYLFGLATKYMMRMGKKGQDDTDKAVHCVEKCAERFSDKKLGLDNYSVLIITNDFLMQNDCTRMQKNAIRYLLMQDYAACIRVLKGYPDEPTQIKAHTDPD